MLFGETGRLISTRVKEHIPHTKNNDKNISAIVICSTDTKHAIEFDNIIKYSLHQMTILK